MINLKNSLLSALLLTTLLLPSPALAKGEVTVEQDNGDTDNYSEVEIFNSPEILYFKPQEGNTMLLITKNECQKEGEILFCDKARAGVETNGVMEELEVAQIALFINPSPSRQPVKGSKVTMGANTVFLEMVTEKGSYVTALGKIDGNTRPGEASK
jgi:hypothetical protein